MGGAGGCRVPARVRLQVTHSDEQRTGEYASDSAGQRFLRRRQAFQFLMPVEDHLHLIGRSAGELR